MQKTRRKETRAIVDPTAWESSEGLGKERTAFDKNDTGKNKVSSMRSSLFQKNAKNKAQKGGSSSNSSDQEAIFKTQSEAEPLKAPFQFENISLAYCEYGKANKKQWTKDILALVHNPVRSELVDLTILMRSVRKMSMGVTIADFSSLRVWWQACSGLMLDYFDLEANLLMLWIKNAVESEKIKDPSCEEYLKSMETRQKDIREIVMNISKSFGKLCDAAVIGEKKGSENITTAQKGLLVLSSFDALVFHTCEYLSEQELRLPMQLTAAYKSEKKERDVILGKIVKYVMKKGRQGESMFVLMTRWMTDSKVAKGVVKTLLEFHECNYSSLQARFEMQHAGFVHQFQVKAG